MTEWVLIVKLLWPGSVYRDYAKSMPSKEVCFEALREVRFSEMSGAENEWLAAAWCQPR